VVGNAKTLPDVSAFSHGDNATIFADVKETILPEDWAGHRLQQDGR
jgi:hypothetical protein